MSARQNRNPAVSGPSPTARCVRGEWRGYEPMGKMLTIARQAAIYKATHKMSYADCFAAALAKIRNCELLTGDPEFTAVENEIKIHWVPSAFPLPC